MAGAAGSAGSAGLAESAGTDGSDGIWFGTDEDRMTGFVIYIMQNRAAIAVLRTSSQG
jgi:hypothetical protein